MNCCRSHHPGSAPGAPLKCDLLEAQLLETFSDGESAELAPTFPPDRHALSRELVQFAFENSTSALTLNDVCRAFSPSTTITVSCRDVFGVGPMNLLKWIRLQQVQYVLQCNQRMDQLGYKNIHEVAAHYGFRSRNHFASDYRKRSASRLSQP